MGHLSRTEAKKKVDEFFLRETFGAEEMIKLKKIAMKYRIKLTGYRKMFCKKCLSKLKGKLRISKGYKIVECANCGFKNKIKLP